MKYEEMKEMLRKLTVKEKEQILEELKRMITLEFLESEYLDDEEIVCPRCGGINIRPKGSHNNKKRFLCRECNRNFGSSTNKIGCTTKLKMEVWLKYAECMIDRLSIKSSAEKVGVGIKTSFLMRHRILECISKNTNKFIVGKDSSAELDECYLRESFKGNHKKSANFIMPRKPRKHGGEGMGSGISNDLICIMTGINDYNDIFMEVACRGRLNKISAQIILEDKINVGSIISTDKQKAYIKVLKEINVLIHNRYDSRDKNYGAINKVNSVHSRFKLFLSKFKGVSTRRLSNYLVWFEWIESFKKVDTDKERYHLLFNQLANGTYKTVTREYKNTPYLFMEYYA